MVDDFFCDCFFRFREVSNRWLIWYLVVCLYSSQLFIFSDTERIASDVELHAFFSQHGIKGIVRIIHHHNEENSTESAGEETPVDVRNTTTIEINLESHMDVDPAPYNWAIYELPVEYTQSISCDKGYLGEK